ncbi:hypothetical protein F383_28345 [Gossypium arboreum]|uniref:Uncharacterized protein n=1 Tax=Gossypium arboreum TaxID=29729 RepID=A0A0B0MVR3_GOSAR|nr:hypothetical protein F383_28868 [Gossypium arboreum]KHG21396.1 hypothetical protein F383_28345 [Gossypium arboreum]
MNLAWTSDSDTSL